MSRALVIGEALIDAVQRADDLSTATVEHPGGSPLNVAFGLARLGHEAYLLTRLGADARGDAIRAHLAGPGVRLVPGVVDDLPTSVAMATLDAAGRASYDFDIHWLLPDVELPPHPHVVHTGSIAAFLEPGAATVERILHHAHGHTTVSYDPNVRPAFMGTPAHARSRVESIVATSDVVKASDEDIAWLVPGEDPAKVASSWLDLGPALVVVTMGAEGALGVSASGTVQVTAPKITVADTVGAGDAFMAGLLDALATAGLLGEASRAALHAVDEATVTEVLGHAIRVSAFTCTRAGAQPPTHAELDAWRP